MADNLKLKFCLSGIQGNCNALEARDLTNAYDATTNPTGWGAPNSLRAEWCLWVLADKTGSGEEREAVTVTPNLAPGLATTWSISAPQDAVYEVLLVAAKAWAPLPTYLKGNVRWGTYTLPGEDPVAGLFIALKDVPTETALSNDEFWKKLDFVDDFPLLGLAHGCHFSLKSRTHICHADACIGAKARKYAREGCEDLAQPIANHLDYFKTTVHYTAAIYASRMADLEEARLQIEMVNKLCCDCHSKKSASVTSTTKKGDCGCGK